MGIRDLIMLVVGFSCVPVALYDAYYGLLAYCWLSFMRPQTLLWNAGGAVGPDYLRRGGCRVWSVSDSNADECSRALREIAARQREGSLAKQNACGSRFDFTHDVMARNLERVLRAAMNGRGRVETQPPE